jgi:hypothetical protein
MKKRILAILVPAIGSFLKFCSIILVLTFLIENEWMHKKYVQTRVKMTLLFHSRAVKMYFPHWF